MLCLSSSPTWTVGAAKATLSTFLPLPSVELQVPLVPALVRSTTSWCSVSSVTYPKSKWRARFEQIQGGRGWCTVYWNEAKLRMTAQMPQWIRLCWRWWIGVHALYGLVLWLPHRVSVGIIVGLCSIIPQLLLVYKTIFYALWGEEHLCD